MAEIENIPEENGEQVMVLEIQTENNGNDSSHIWSRYKGLFELERDREATMLLIDMYQKYSDKLNNKYTRKKFVWEAIAAELTNMGYQVDGDRCHQKWRNMERIFRKHLQLVKTASDSEKLKNAPEFFEKMYSVIGNKQFRTVNWTPGGMNNDGENSTDDEAELALSDIDGTLSSDISRKRRHSLTSSSSSLLNKRPRTVNEAVNLLFKVLSEQQEQHMRLLREQLDRQYQDMEKTFQTFLGLLAQQQLIHIEQPSDIIIESSVGSENICIVSDVQSVNE